MQIYPSFNNALSIVYSRWLLLASFERKIMQSSTQPLFSILGQEKTMFLNICWGCMLRGRLTEAKDCPAFNRYCYYFCRNNVDDYNTNVHYKLIQVFSQQFKYYIFNNIFDTCFFFQIFWVTPRRVVGVPLASLTTTCP